MEYASARNCHVRSATLQLGSILLNNQASCPGCGMELNFPRDARPDELRFLRAESGWLIMRGPEEPVHRCATLSDSDAVMLLQDTEWLSHQDLPEN